MAQISTDYSYDALGRLTSAVNSDGKTVGYGYDYAGNRTQLSNMVIAGEIIPVAFTASNSIVGTGLSTPGGMRDSVFNAATTIHATAASANSWITADLGIPKQVNHIDFAPATFGSYTAANLNGVSLQWSNDNATWTTIGQVSGAVLNAYVSVPVGGVTARYFRLFQTSATPIAIGDFRLYSTSVTNDRPPVANAFSVILPSTGGQIDVASHVSDPDNDPLSVSLVNQPTAAQHGTAVAVSGTTTITYTPTAGNSGTDTFSYTVSDGRNMTATNLITVTVTAPVNHSPVAVSESVGTPPNLPITVSALLNDSDPDGDTLTIQSVTGVGLFHGSVTTDGLTITYTPAFAYQGTEQFTYTITDNHGGTASATDTVTVAPGAGDNHQPVAHLDVTTITENTTLSNFNPLANDIDVDGDTLTISSITNAAHGNATLNSSHLTVNYVPNTNFNGTDTFNYTISDGRGGSSTGTIDVVVQVPANRAPVAVNDFASTMGGTLVTIYPLANDSDPDGNPIFLIPATINTGHGTAIVDQQAGEVRYQPAPGFVSTDSFTYTIEDNFGATASATITVSVANNPPFQNPVVLSTGYNTPKSFDPRTGPTDYDGQAVTVVSLTQPQSGAGSATLSGNMVTYTPAAGFSGNAVFTYTVQDTAGGSFTGSITIAVSPPSSLQVTSVSRWDGGRLNNGATYGGTVTATVSGGTAPYTYNWVRTDGEASITAGIPDGPTTSFAYSLSVVGSHTATFVCRVTDANGIWGDTAPIAVTYDYENGS